LFGAPATCKGEEEQDGLEEGPVNEFDERKAPEAPKGRLFQGKLESLKRALGEGEVSS
jgi:hypothetical protein